MADLLGLSFEPGRLADFVGSLLSACYIPITGQQVTGFLGNCLGACNLIFKGYLGVTFMMWLRWTLPRLRIDQVMTTCLKYCVPLGLGHALGHDAYNLHLAWRAGLADIGLSVLARPLAIHLGRSPLAMEPIHWESFFFLLFALVACAFALAVVVSGNIVRMAFYLIVSLGAVAGLFFLLQADFLGAMQLMVYVGGTLVLLAFGVMLTARSPFVSLRSGGGPMGHGRAGGCVALGRARTDRRARHANRHHRADPRGAGKSQVAHHAVGHGAGGRPHGSPGRVDRPGQPLARLLARIRDHLHTPARGAGRRRVFGESETAHN